MTQARNPPNASTAPAKAIVSSFFLVLGLIAVSSDYTMCRIDTRDSVIEYVYSCHRFRRLVAPTMATLSGLPPTVRIRPWFGRRFGTDTAPGLSTWSTPPDPLNRIHSRRSDLIGRGFGTSEPLGRS